MENSVTVESSCRKNGRVIIFVHCGFSFLFLYLWSFFLPAKVTDSVSSSCVTFWLLLRLRLRQDANLLLHNNHNNEFYVPVHVMVISPTSEIREKVNVMFQSGHVRSCSDIQILIQRANLRHPARPPGQLGCSNLIGWYVGNHDDLNILRCENIKEISSLNLAWAKKSKFSKNNRRYFIDNPRHRSS